MSSINTVTNSGRSAAGVVDFNATGEAGMTITVGGTVYTEADTAVATNGVFTNGASAADSATSLVAAINGDTRFDSVPITAVISAVGDSVFLIADEAGTAGNMTVTTTSASACTVGSMVGGSEGRHQVYLGRHVVTAQDILADQIVIPVPFAPAGAEVTCRTTAGLLKAATYLVTTAASPNRVVVTFAGATDPIATDVLMVMAV